MKDMKDFHVLHFRPYCKYFAVITSGSMLTAFSALRGEKSSLDFFITGSVKLFLDKRFVMSVETSPPSFQQGRAPSYDLHMRHWTMYEYQNRAANIQLFARVFSCQPNSK
jgi:hypothetical protein